MLGGQPTGSDEMLVQRRREHSKSVIKTSLRNVRSPCTFLLCYNENGDSKARTKYELH